MRGIGHYLRVFWVTAALDWERRGEADLRRRRKEGNINAGVPLDAGRLIFASLNLLHTPPHNNPSFI